MKKIFNRLSGFYAALILAAVVAITHIDVLLMPAGQYFASYNWSDLNYYINIRSFVFESLKLGVFPFWTTKILCGIPIFANSESAIFYPLNFIYFLLPVSKAINFSFILHFFILGFSSFLWLNNKTKNKFISLFTAVICMFFSGSYLHACAAHLSNINTFCWFPFLLYFYDKSFEKKSYFYILPVSAVIAFQIFAGHLQYVYYTALVCLIYVVVFCRNRYAFVTLISSYVFSLLLTAVQLVPSLDFYFEGDRQLGEVKAFSYFSKLKYLITLFFPKYVTYTDKFFWETAVYFGTLNFFAVVTAVIYCFNKNIFKFCCAALFFYLLTFKPFADIADKIIPCFSLFRSPVKLIFFCQILMLPVLAQGIRYILSKRLNVNKTALFCLAAVSVFVMFSFREISSFMIDLFNYKTMEIPDKYDLYNSIIYSGILMFLFAALMMLKKYKLPRIIIAAMLILEPVVVMKTFSHKYDFKNNCNFDFYKQENFNEQTRFFFNVNLDLMSRKENVSGVYPDKILNYVKFMNYLRKEFNTENILGLLRCRYIVNGEADKIISVDDMRTKTLKRLNLMFDYKVEPDKHKIYEILEDKNFDIFNTAVLEKEPQYKPVNTENAPEYGLKILYFDENSIVFECVTSEPAIVLYTDNYTKGWKAYELTNPKKKYEVLCADYIYKAISVDKGRHVIKIEYFPRFFYQTAVVSGAAWIVWLLVFFWNLRKKLKSF